MEIAAWRLFQFRLFRTKVRIPPNIRLRPSPRSAATFAIEPVNAGRYDVEWTDDDWTVITEDGSFSAHYQQYDSD